MTGPVSHVNRPIFATEEIIAMNPLAHSLGGLLFAPATNRDIAPIF